jgi:hypothetical protein
MRVAGYILLLLGFAMLLFHGLYAREWAGGSVARADGRLPKQSSYAHQEVIAGMSDAAFDARETFGGVAVPGSMMFCGGVLLDLARRRRAAA